MQKLCVTGSHALMLKIQLKSNLYCSQLMKNKNSRKQEKILKKN